MSPIEQCPELSAGQSEGRPAWQRGLPLKELAKMDAMLEEAKKSEEAMDAYLEYTGNYLMSHLKPGLDAAPIPLPKRRTLMPALKESDETK